MIFIVLIITTIFSFICGCLFIRVLQVFIGDYEKIKLPTKWLNRFIGVEYLWKKYKPSNDEELKFIKNKLRTEYPALTMILTPKQNIVLNHKTMHVSFGKILNRFVSK